MTYAPDAPSTVAAASAHQPFGASVISSAAHGRVQVVRVDPSKRDQLRAAYSSLPGVQAVSLDEPMSVLENPNDPLYAYDPPRTDGSDAGFTEGWSLDAIGAPSAWNVTHGDGIKVAVLDTGIRADHPDLTGQVVAQIDLSGSTTGPQDIFGHGTHVAGIIAAIENNATDSSGVAPRAQLLNAKVIRDNGSGWSSDVINGIEWAIGQHARVINMSLGGPIPCDTAYQTAIDDAWNAGVVVVAAAGNDGADNAVNPISPANCNHVLSVAATTRGGPSAWLYHEGIAYYSNYGSNVMVAAPGDSVFSTMLTSGAIYDPTGFGALSGTSMASPQVAGVAALVWATPYGTSPTAVVDRIETTSNSAVPGSGTQWKYGRVDAAAAVGIAPLSAPAQVLVGLGSTSLTTQPQTDQMSANWTAVSGAAGYEYAIGTTSGARDVVGWTNNGATLAMTQLGLSMQNGASYYVSARAYDTGNMRSAATNSPGVLIQAAAATPTSAPTTATPTPTGVPTPTATPVPTKTPTQAPTATPTTLPTTTPTGSGSSNVVIDAAGYVTSTGGSQVSMLPAPTRLVDTRLTTGMIAAGQSQCVQVAGVNGIPANAGAVLLNVAAVSYSQSGWLTLYPSGKAVPPTSTVNFDPHEYAIANNAIVSIGTDEKVCINSGNAPSNAILDATGFVTAAGQSTVKMLDSPRRLVDTRNSTAGILGAGGSRCFTVTGFPGMPSDASAALLNVTAVGYSRFGWLTVYPAGQAAPATSTVNFDVQEYAIANGAIVNIGTGGQVCVNAGNAASHVILDIAGYVTAAGASQVTMLTTPVRLVDTRATAGAGSIQQGTSRCFTVAGASGIPSNASAVMLNVTGVTYTANGWLTLYPSQVPVPSTSTVNFDKTQYAVANGATVSVGTDGQLCVNVGMVP